MVGKSATSVATEVDDLVWETLATEGVPTARHEAALIGVKGKLYLLGGRRINPVDVFDTSNQTWTAKSPTPIELHHFQAIAMGEDIYMMGAMTGKYPRETSIEKIVVYHTPTDTFEFVHSIPESRRRGGAGAAIYGGKIYLVGGITNGHVDGSRAWLDEYDPSNGEWNLMPDAPHARDHFQAAVIGDRLYAAGGRRTSQATQEVFSLTEEVIDVFDFTTRQWLPVEQCPMIPTPRAGNSCVAINGKLVIGGGESMSSREAHKEVEVYDPATNQWTTWPAMENGRHGTGLVPIGGFLYTASGSGGRGGGPELDSTERIRIK